MTLFRGFLFKVMKFKIQDFNTISTIFLCSIILNKQAEEKTYCTYGRIYASASTHRKLSLFFTKRYFSSQY